MTTAPTKACIIRKFDASTIGNGAVVLVVGKRASGKTTLVNDIIAQQRSPRACTVLSGKATYDDVTHGSAPLDVHDLTAAKEWLATAAGASSSCLVVDGCLFGTEHWNDFGACLAAAKHREQQRLVIVATSFLYRLHAAVRVDCTFVMLDPMPSSRRRIYNGKRRRTKNDILSVQSRGFQRSTQRSRRNQ